MAGTKDNHSLIKELKTYRKVFLIFAIVGIITAVFGYQYYKNLSSTIREESKNYLEEITSRISSNINRIVDDNFGVLYTMSAVLENADKETFDEAKKTLQKQQPYWDYEELMLIDSKGKAYDLNNEEVFLTIDNSIIGDILDHRQTMSTTQLINNKEYILFSVPLNNVEIDGTEMSALIACYNPASFDRVLSMASFDEQAYSQIITKSGTVVIRSSSEFAMNTGYNIFSSIQDSKLDKGSSLEKVQEDIKNNQTGQIEFIFDNVHRYMVYTPIDYDGWYLLTFVPVQVVNARSDILLKSTLFICGIIALVFAGLVASLISVFGNHKRKLERMAFVDTVTGGNTIQRFYELAREILDLSVNEKFVLIYTNLVKFKVLNEQLGRKNCDMTLKLFNDFISSNLKEQECMGRIMADNFCILLKYEDEKELITRFTEWYVNAEKFLKKEEQLWTLPGTEFGIYVIEDNTLSFPQMIDRAKLALKENTWTIDNKLSYAFYDDKIRQKLIREKQLEDIMEESLANEEFRVYLQPKYHLPEECIGGAEALVRWQNPTDGMIFPDEFIPLFEKNGFIIQVDLWVFEVVCRTMRKWIDCGLEPMKISVNCSRVHFKYSNFLSPYIRIASQYGINKDRIEIELTESVVFENTEHLLKIIAEIKEAGFGCSMDDFGSGYSSLNMIQSIPVDTLKLDKIFFHGKASETERTEAVVQSIVNMAKALSMDTVAEGVEQRDQVEMLKKAGCDYIQGYVFAKPMPINMFEELAFGNEKE